MIFQATAVASAYFINVKQHEDNRATSVRSFRQPEFAALNINPMETHCSVINNWRQGRLQGRHSPAPPDDKAELVGCIAESLYDTPHDLRAGRPAHLLHPTERLDVPIPHGLYVLAGDCSGYKPARG